MVGIIEKIVRRSSKNARVILQNGQSEKIPSDLAVIGAHIDLSESVEMDNIEKIDVLDTDGLKRGENGITDKECKKDITLFKSRNYDICVKENNWTDFHDQVLELENKGYKLIYYRITSELHDAFISKAYYAELKKPA
jgi:hypothetical protein